MCLSSSCIGNMDLKRELRRLALYPFLTTAYQFLFCKDLITLLLKSPHGEIGTQQGFSLELSTKTKQRIHSCLLRILSLPWVSQLLVWECIVHSNFHCYHFLNFIILFSFNLFRGCV